MSRSASIMLAAALAAVPTQVLAEGVVSSQADWRLAEAGSTALVSAGKQQSGAMLGVQCDPNDMRGRRLIFGAYRNEDGSGLLRALTTTRPKVINISVESQSAWAEFGVALEGKGQLSQTGVADYIAGYLSAEQYALIRNARSVTIKVGEKVFWFTGNGSLSATNSLVCGGASPIRASRMAVESASRPKPPQKQLLQSRWVFAPGLLTPDPARGSYQAFSSVSGFPGNELASFNFEVTCRAGQLHAMFRNGSVHASVKDAAAQNATAFMKSVNGPANTAEVYAGGKMLARFPVEPGKDGKGHPLSAKELQALMKFDQIVVAGQTTTVEFGGNEGPSSILALAQACGASKRS
ncbi:MAG TPA: hypothetical protein PLM58_17220 [Novosphingobium sp.]|nr:hypothetical protein [Novosphingobium sp.]